MQNIGEMLRIYFEHEGITQSEIADRMDVPPSYVNAILAGRKKVGKKTAEKMSNLFGLSQAWLLTGEGDMLNTAGRERKASSGIPFLGDGEVVNAGALTGYGEGLSRYDITDVVSLPALPWRDGDFAVRTRGRSMIDKQHPEQNINDGAIVCLRPWKERHIQWGEIYCIATTDGYAVKRLMPGSDERHVTCVSSNETEGYAPYQVEYEEIQGIAKVTAIINMQLL